ncbi:uncharacterized protein I303_103853 [Kwoniella dejecticola CBS 10117]|uniref:Uncharacterized protein n=1 Tax=Kwoniella dejecticola CBS 10117 TaxID=1296121 RepID=A0A1A6A7X1_9TREE|nr:uncharacterized protein I303_03872 [Kwoniella dejecticola CBS 10117]OBR86152.1 hypothetical protein I303_03872 [Kwoniella dejecticola CBS 10117]
MNQLSDLEFLNQTIVSDNTQLKEGSDAHDRPRTDGEQLIKPNGSSKLPDRHSSLEGKSSNSTANSHSHSHPDTSTCTNTNSIGSTNSRTHNNPEIPDLDSLHLDPSTVQSLSDLLALSDSDLENLDDSQIEGIMKQLEVADEVADDLEGKLDRLLSTLGGVEEDIVASAPGPGAKKE